MRVAVRQERYLQPGRQGEALGQPNVKDPKGKPLAGSGARFGTLGTYLLTCCIVGTVPIYKLADQWHLSTKCLYIGTYVEYER